MDIFSQFCNICLRTDNVNLKNIYEENMEHLKDTLITCTGRADIINKNMVYLCQSCCEELSRFGKFKEMCVCNVIQLRQKYFDMKWNLELKEDTATVKILLKEFVHSELQRYNSIGKSNNADSFCTELQEIVIDSIKNDAICNKRALNLHPEINGLESVGNCSDTSLIYNNDDSQIEFAKELQYNNEIPDIGNIDFDVPDVNSFNCCDTSQIQFVQEVHMEDISKNVGLKCFVNESSENVQCVLDACNINNGSECRSSRTQFTKEPDEGLYIDVPDIGTSNGCDTLKLEFTKEVNINKEMLQNIPENVNLEEVESEFDKSLYIVPDIDTNNGCDSLQLEFTKEAVNINTEMLQNISENVNLEEVESDPDEGLYIDEPHIDASKSCDNLQIEFTKEEVNRNKGMLQNISDITLEKEPDEGLNIAVSDTDQSKTCDIPQNEFTKELHTKFKIQYSTAKDTKYKYIKSISGEVLHYDFLMPVISISERCDDYSQIESTQELLPFEIGNIISAMENFLTREGDIVAMELESGDSTSTSGAVLVDTQHIAEVPAHGNKRPTTPQSATQEHVNFNRESHICCICNKSFEDSITLIVHQLTHRGAKPFKCTICTKAYRIPSDLTKHELSHNGTMPHKCSDCNKTFDYLSSLNKHKRYHRNRPFKCSVCNQSFKTADDLATHVRTCTGTSLYECSICKKLLKTSYTLSVHERLHKNNGSYKCRVCGQAFDKSCTSTAHEYIYSRVRPYKCRVCKKVFKRSCHLLAHERLHSGKSLYKCTFCKKTFKDSSILIKHKLTHNGTNPYKRSVYNQAFSHASRHGHTDKSCKCSVCERTFSHPKKLAIHARVHIRGKDKSYRCPLCNKTMSAHIRTYSTTMPFNCTGGSKQGWAISTRILYNDLFE